jgi:hypothetical protein
MWWRSIRARMLTMGACRTPGREPWVRPHTQEGGGESSKQPFLCLRRPGRSGSSEPLRNPVYIRHSYVNPGEEQSLFPNCQTFLTRETVLAAFPSGVVTHEVSSSPYLCVRV